MRIFLRSKSSLIPLAVLVGAVALVVTTGTLTAVLGGDTGWARATTAAGLVTTVVAAGVLLATARGWANGTRLSLAASAVAVVGLGALALTAVTYIGGASDAGSSVVVDTIADDDTGDTDVGLALSQQVSNNEVQPPGFAHDVGVHPTFGGFISMDNAAILRNSPGGTLLPNEVDKIREQLAATRAFLEEHDTIEKALAANYTITTNDVPFMGAHLLNFGYVADGVFDPSKPEGLLFSKLGGGPDAEWQLTGAWFLLIPGLNPGVTEAIPPDGFAGNLDLWHQHHGLCTRNGVISENNTEESCLSDGGNYQGELKWMMHVWVWPETADNVDGVFTYLNYGLFEKQQQNVQGEPLGR